MENMELWLAIQTFCGFVGDGLMCKSMESYYHTQEHCIERTPAMLTGMWMHALQVLGEEPVFTKVNCEFVQNAAS